MNYYTNACEQLEGANILAASKKYRLAVTMLCLSCELFLKSLAEYKDPMNPFLNSHDLLGLGNMIKEDVNFSAIRPKLTFLRKYLNDSRYPYSEGIYTKEFYDECLESVSAVRKEIDSANAGKSDMDRLTEHFGFNKVTDKTNNK